jgi:hypothetical protein
MPNKPKRTKKMYWQTKGNKKFSDVKNIKAWVCALASTFPCLPIEKQPKEKRLSKRRINFLAAFPIGVILPIKRTCFKFEYKRLR